MMHGEARLDEMHDRVVRISMLAGLRELTPEIDERIEILVRQGYANDAAAELLRKQLGAAHNTRHE
jgi:hypothetical protein